MNFFLAKGLNLLQETSFHSQYLPLWPPEDHPLGFSFSLFICTQAAFLYLFIYSDETNLTTTTDISLMHRFSNIYHICILFTITTYTTVYLLSTIYTSKIQIPYTQMYLPISHKYTNMSLFIWYPHLLPSLLPCLGKKEK